MHGGAGEHALGRPRRNGSSGRLSGTSARVNVAGILVIFCFIGSLALMGYIKLWVYQFQTEEDTSGESYPRPNVASHLSHISRCQI